MKEKFKSDKSFGFGALLIIVSFLLIFLFFGLPLLSGNMSVDTVIIGSLIIIFVLSLFIWFWVSTCYFIESETLKIISGPFHWIIPIQDINSIRLNQNTIGGIIKPSLSWKCIEIDYGKDKTISIYPQIRRNLSTP